jgi:hypothetical protein
VADAQDIALLLAEGETAKAKSLSDWLNERDTLASSAVALAARTVLWRTHFAHMAAAKRYLEIAQGKDGVDLPDGGKTK